MNFLPIAGADVAERTRRFAFLLTIIGALYGGYLYVPETPHTTLPSRSMGIAASTVQPGSVA